MKAYFVVFFMDDGTENIRRVDDEEMEQLVESFLDGSSQLRFEVYVVGELIYRCPIKK